MIKFIKKIVRTSIVFFPFLRRVTAFLKRILQAITKSAVEEDFNVIDFFPKTQDLVFLDIGGNWGFIIDVMLRKSKGCKVYSFEPNPELHNSTKPRFNNNPQVTLLNFGLGDIVGSIKLYVPIYKGYMFDGLGSLSTNFDDSWLASKLFFYNKKKLVIKEIDCQIKRLDDLNLSPFFMKIDVEGAEFNVIKGGQQTISNSRPIILIESGERDDEILNFLSQFGYKMYRYKNGKFTEGERGSPNTFFITDEKYRIILEGIKLKIN